MAQTATADEQINKNLRALWANHVGPGLRFVVLEGGTRSGKTYSALEYLLNVAVGLPNMAIGVFRYNVSTCRESSFKDAKAIIASKSIKGA
ncbi:MAG: hypothetical protein MJH10_21665, partial [Epibacterium sp.]|nr:hypothetical protein [Epibacterium sp.]NQX76058.1 hypothetical protein [Epibacterium sp.]